MANTTYEEERKRPEIQKPQAYDYAAPQGTYYGEQGNAQSDMADEILRRAAEQADPQRQAEEDARIQRGRNFWTGANLFANVVANAINVNGTAKGAPNMTWNDAASQKMYDTWRTADQQLKADRKAAQQRFDALRSQDAQMRAAGAEKRAAERQRANDMNFNIALEEARHERALQEKEADRGYAEQLAEKKRQQDLEDYEKKLKMQARYRPRTTGRSGSGTKSAAGTKTPSVGKNSIVSGGITMNVNTKSERDTMYRSMYNEMERWIKEHPKAMPEGVKMPTDEYGKRKFVDDHFGDLCKDNPDFMDEMQGYYGDLLMLDDDFTNGVDSSHVVEDPYAEVVATPEFEQFAGHSVRPDESSLPDPRRYAGTAPNQTPRAYRGNPVTWNTSPIRQTPHELSEGEKELLKKGGKKPKIDY